MTPLRSHPADAPIGVLLMILSVVGAVATIWVSAVVALFAGFFGVSAGPHFVLSHGQLEENSPSMLIPGLIMGILLAACVAGFLVGLGIAKSSRTAFRVGIIVFGLIALGGTAGGLFGVAGAVYCVLRLGGSSSVD